MRFNIQEYTFLITNVSRPLLFKSIWLLQSDNLLVDHKLLPVTVADIVINLYSSIYYDGLLADNIHLRGILDKITCIKQTGPVFTLGITLSEQGLYLIGKHPISSYINANVPLKGICTIDPKKIVHILSEPDHIENRILWIINHIDSCIRKISSDDFIFFSVFNELKHETNFINIKSFCDRLQCSRRTFERHFKKYIGISPNKYKQVIRFNKTRKQIFKERLKTFTDITYEMSYYDQMHMIKEFKKFANCTPSYYKDNKIFVKQLYEKN